MVKIYHNPRCTKSRQTLSILEEKSSNIEVIEYLKNPPSKAELLEIIKLLRCSPLDIIRKGEEEFRLHFKERNLSDEDWIDLMLKFPQLIERPIVINGTKAAIGRPPENVLTIL